MIGKTENKNPPKGGFLTGGILQPATDSTILNMFAIGAQREVFIFFTLFREHGLSDFLLPFGCRTDSNIKRNLYFLIIHFHLPNYFCNANLKRLLLVIPVQLRVPLCRNPRQLLPYQRLLSAAQYAFAYYMVENNLGIY